MTIVGTDLRDPIIEALKNDDQSKLQELLLPYPDLNLIIPKKIPMSRKETISNSPLDYDAYLIDFAAYFGAENCLRYILSELQTIKHFDKKLFGLQHFTAYSGNSNILQILTDYNFDLTLLTKDQMSFLHIAAEQGFTSMCEWLWINSPHFHELSITLNKQGYSPLHLAGLNHHFDTINFLIKVGCDPYFKTQDGRTLFNIGIASHDFEIIDYFLEHPEIQPKPDKNGTYPIHAATFYELSDLIDGLIAIGHDINQLNGKHQNVLHIAAACGHFDMCIKFLEFGFDVNSVDSNQHTPLHLAARGGFADVCDLLIDYGAEIGPVDLKGFTPMNLAYKARKKDCVNLFELYGQNNDLLFEDEIQ